MEKELGVDLGWAQRVRDSRKLGVVDFCQGSAAALVDHIGGIGGFPNSDLVRRVVFLYAGHRWLDLR